MKTLVLHGELAQRFGERFEMDVRSPIEAFRLMDVNFKGEFRKMVEGKRFEIRLGSRQVTPDHLYMNCGSREEIHLLPEMSGSKGFGFLFSFPLLGSAFPAGGLLGGLGGAGAAGGAFGGLGSILFGVAILGVGALISSALRPKEQKEREQKDKNSFLFDGPVNTIEQGGPVPLVYGRVRTGSIVISAGLAIEQVS